MFRNPASQHHPPCCFPDLGCQQLSFRFLRQPYHLYLLTFQSVPEIAARMKPMRLVWCCYSPAQNHPVDAYPAQSRSQVFGKILYDNPPCQETHTTHPYIYTHKYTPGHYSLISLYSLSHVLTLVTCHPCSSFNMWSMPPTWGLFICCPLCLELPSHKNPQSFTPSLPSIYYSNVTLLVSPCETGHQVGLRPTIFQLKPHNSSQDLRKLRFSS